MGLATTTGTRLGKQREAMGSNALGNSEAGNHHWDWQFWGWQPPLGQMSNQTPIVIDGSSFQVHGSRINVLCERSKVSHVCSDGASVAKRSDTKARLATTLLHASLDEKHLKRVVSHR